MLILYRNTGFLHVFPNKGGLCISLTIYGSILSFVSCHLTAHEGVKKCQMRNESVYQSYPILAHIYLYFQPFLQYLFMLKKSCVWCIIAFYHFILYKYFTLISLCILFLGRRDPRGYQGGVPEAGRSVHHLPPHVLVRGHG